ncbi:MAG: phosphoadenylyl-sulfate reductase [Bacteroidales bacterium]|nr:phosphoadenylyl-sulfate reductase [Bacteroidales bacterium]
MQNEILKLNQKLQASKPEEIIKYFLNTYKNKIVFASSLGLEDQIILKIISDIDRKTNIFTLDTGRLFPETYDLIQRSESRYKIKIKIYFPDAEKVEQMVNTKGINLFYNSIEDRKLCCKIRKLDPLKRALKNFDVWICGLRKEQSVTRTDLQIVEWDENNKMLKVNPLINWTYLQVREYIKNNKIPYNPLHDKGFPSIGCQPCTRAITDNEDIRSGRWWWENPETKECGLHVKEG